MPFIATISLTDSMNRVVSKRVETEADVLATAQAAVAALITDLEAITDLGVVAVAYSLYDPSEASAAADPSNVDTGATFVLRKTDGGKVSYKIPGFPQAKADGAGNIDPEDVDVVAFFDNFKAAGAFTLSDGETITAVLSGKMDQ